MDNEELLRLSHDHINGYIKAADQKASILLSGQLAFLALLIGTMPDNILNMSVLIQIVAGLTVLSNVIAVFFSISTISPIENTDNERGFIFWKEILEHEGSGEFEEKVRELDSEDALNSLSAEVYDVSEVANEKYDTLTKAIYSTSAFIILAIILATLYIV